MKYKTGDNVSVHMKDGDVIKMKLTKTKLKEMIREELLKESKLIEAKVADSTGNSIEAGKWYRFTFGKRNQKIKVVSIDSKGIKFYDPQDDWKYTISMKMVNKRKIGGYMTPLK